MITALVDWTTQRSSSYRASAMARTSKYLRFLTRMDMGRTSNRAYARGGVTGWRMTNTRACVSGGTCGKGGRAPQA